MEKAQLPVRQFSFNVEININEILKPAVGSSVGNSVKSVLNCPIHLRDNRWNFQLNPTKGSVQDDWLVDYQFELKKQHKLLNSLLKFAFRQKTMCCVTNFKIVR